VEINLIKKLVLHFFLIPKIPQIKKSEVRSEKQRKFEEAMKV